MLVLLAGAATYWFSMGRGATGAPAVAVPGAKPAASASAAAKAPVVFELAASETVVAAPQTLAQTVALTGSLKAAKTAVVKVRVAGEITGLTLREGDAVKAGQVVARIDPTEVAARLRQATDQAESARAQVDIAQRQWDNNQSLVQQGFISKTALENAAASLAGAKATFQAAKAAVDLAQQSVDDTVLRAPIAGVVASKGVQNGERAGVEARVIEIVDLSSLEMEAALPVQDAALVKVGQVAQLSIEGVAGPALRAKVVRINPSVQAGSRSVTVYLSVAPQPTLKNGLFVQGELSVGATTGVAVPLSAVRIDKPNPYVQVIASDKVSHQAVTLGAKGKVDGQAFVIVQGLQDGTRLASGTVGQIREGTLVKVTQGTGPANAPVQPTKAAISASSGSASQAQGQ